MNYHISVPTLGFVLLALCALGCVLFVASTPRSANKITKLTQILTYSSIVVG